MDEPRAVAYVAPVVNLLLLFSALLSALTGISGSARTAVPQALSQRVVSVAPVGAAAATARVRPTPPLPRLASVARLCMAVVAPRFLASREMLTNRRRE